MRTAISTLPARNDDIHPVGRLQHWPGQRVEAALLAHAAVAECAVISANRPGSAARWFEAHVVLAELSRARPPGTWPARCQWSMSMAMILRLSNTSAGVVLLPIALPNDTDAARFKRFSHSASAWPRRSRIDHRAAQAANLPKPKPRETTRMKKLASDNRARGPCHRRTGRSQCSAWIYPAVRAGGAGLGL